MNTESFKNLFNNLVEVRISEKTDGDFRPNDSEEFEKKISKLREELKVSQIIAPTPGYGGNVSLYNEKDFVEGPGGIIRTKNPSDGYIITTREPPSAIAYFVADSPTVVVLTKFSKHHYALGILVCGWEPLAKKILDNFMEKVESLATGAMLEKQSIRRSLKVVITPGIGQCCYEVNEEIANKLASKYKKAQQLRNLYKQRCYIKSKDKEIYVDLAKICWCYFEELGVTDLTSSKICTKCSGRFFSHRQKDKERNAVIAAFSPQAFPKENGLKRKK